MDEALDKSTIADLSSASISEMDREELIRVIRAAELPLIDARILARLPDLDPATLERLAHLARGCCQNWGHCDST